MWNAMCAMWPCCKQGRFCVYSVNIIRSMCNIVYWYEHGIWLPGRPAIGGLIIVKIYWSIYTNIYIYIVIVVVNSTTIEKLDYSSYSEKWGPFLYLVCPTTAPAAVLQSKAEGKNHKGSGESMADTHARNTLPAQILWNLMYDILYVNYWKQNAIYIWGNWAALLRKRMPCNRCEL